MTPEQVMQTLKLDAWAQHRSNPAQVKRLSFILTLERRIWFKFNTKLKLTMQPLATKEIQ